LTKATGSSESSHYSVQHLTRDHYLKMNLLTLMQKLVLRSCK